MPRQKVITCVYMWRVQASDKDTSYIWRERWERKEVIFVRKDDVIYLLFFLTSSYFFRRHLSVTSPGVRSLSSSSSLAVTRPFIRKHRHFCSIRSKLPCVLRLLLFQEQSSFFSFSFLFSLPLSETLSLKEGVWLGALAKPPRDWVVAWQHHTRQMSMTCSRGSGSRAHTENMCNWKGTKTCKQKLTGNHLQWDQCHCLLFFSWPRSSLCHCSLSLPPSRSFSFSLPLSFWVNDSHSSRIPKSPACVSLKVLCAEHKKLKRIRMVWLNWCVHGSVSLNTSIQSNHEHCHGFLNWSHTIYFDRFHWIQNSRLPRLLIYSCDGSQVSSFL